MILTVTVNPAIDKVYEVENFHIDEVFRPKNMWATSGGKGLNVSRVAATLGGKVTATGFLGGGNGDFIRRGLREEGLRDAFVDIEGESRICIAINDPLNNSSTEILEKGPHISGSEIDRFLDNFKKEASLAKVITISGSLAEGLPEDFYADIIKIAKNLEKPVLLDTSGKALKAGIKAIPFMIKPNRSEFLNLFDREDMTEDEIIEGAREIHESGIDLVCISLAEEGLIAYSESGPLRLRAPAIDVISSVGSGDSFIGAFALAKTWEYPLEDALRFAMAAAMANTQFPATGKVSQELVDRFLPTIYRV